MRSGRSLSTERHERYDEVHYRDALQRLGLHPPVDVDEIHRAYRVRAQRVHPDRFVEEEEKLAATRRIQEINAARDYAVTHFRGFQIYQNARYRRNGINGDGEDRSRWIDWSLFPLIVLYAAATLALAVPVAVATAFARHRGRQPWVVRSGQTGRIVWRLWIALGSHAVLVALFFAPLPWAVSALSGISFLAMGAGDVATLITGDPNELRMNPVLVRARSLAERALSPG